MKKIYSIVLMAAMLLVGTNAWAAVRTAHDDATLQTAWSQAQTGDVIQLTSDITLTKSLWLGTETMNGAFKSLTLDLNGHTLQAEAGVKKVFIITHGKLEVKNGQIIHQGTDAKNSTHEIFRVTGSTYKNINPKTEDIQYYSHLIIDADVTLTAHSNAVVVDYMAFTTSDKEAAYADWNHVIATAGVSNNAKSWPAALNTVVYNKDANKTTGNRGLANGARVDVYGAIYAPKYALKTNGNLGGPSLYSWSKTDSTAGTHKFWADADETTPYAIAATDVNYAPFIYIHNTARLETTEPGSKAAVAAYSSGYARWMVEGTCIGSSAVYVKSGEVVLNNAVVESNYVPTEEETYQPIAGRGAGVDAGGSGISIESNTASYTGDINVVVQGDTKVTATTGMAVDEFVAPGTQTEVEVISIQGGTFEAGDAGTIKISEPTATNNLSGTGTQIEITGATAEGTITLGDPENQHSLDEIIKPAAGETSVHVTYVDNGEGGTTMVISQGEAPAQANAVYAEGSDESRNVSWNGTSETLENDLLLGELEMNLKDGVGVAQDQVLYVGNDDHNVTLSVARVVMGSKAKIVVNAGSKLIITGSQGIVAPSVNNIVLKTSETAQAIFLFNPAVISNRHPNATVEFDSKAYYEGGKTVYQRFGLPAYEESEIKLEYADPSSDVLTYIVNWDYTADTWADDWIPVPAASGLTIAKSAPFACFEMVSNNAKASKMSYTFKGALVGNDNAEMSFNKGFNPYANSYMAPVDIETFLDRIAANYPSMQAAMWVYQALSNDNYVWRGIGQADFEFGGKPDITKIAPMQPYNLNLIEGNTYNAAISYNDNVYAPFIAANAAAGAPARQRTSKQNFMKLNISDESGVVYDYARLIEDARFSEAFDNGYDITKYMNDNVSLYVVAENALSTLASDDIENTYVGVNVAEAGTYTLSIDHNGLDYALVDLENNNVIDLVEGNTYNFYADGKNDARFKVVKVNKVITGIEDTQDNQVMSTKYVKDGVLYILKNGAVYNAQGQVIK